MSTDNFAGHPGKRTWSAGQQVVSGAGTVRRVQPCRRAIAAAQRQALAGIEPLRSRWTASY